MKETSQFEPRRRARRRALQALYQWQITRQEIAEIIGQFQEEQDFTNVDQDLFLHLLNGVVRDYTVLDESLTPFLDRPLEQLDVMELLILRMSSFELQNNPEVPFAVLLNEAIDLAKRFGAEQGHNFINAVLDKAAGEWRKEEKERKSGPSD
jgi:N utilization substance protein B